MIKYFNRLFGFFSLLALSFQFSLANREQSLADLELSKIVALQKRFFDQGESWSDSELTRQAQEIVTRYELHIAENPRDLEALVLFGKFLRKTGQSKVAMGFFLEADKLNPNLAVIKQQIGNFLTEQGDPASAFPFFIMATRLSPDQAIYHYNLGDFIYLFEEKLELTGNSEKEDLTRLMHESFKEAARLDPENFDFHLRFAQSFFDLKDPDFKLALNAWNTLLNEFGKRTDRELEYINLCKSRILLETQSYEAAVSLLDKIKSEALAEQKNSLLQKASLKNKDVLRNEDANNERKKGSGPKTNTGAEKSNSYTFPSDAHLQKMKKITRLLLEEKWLQDFRQDVVQARVLSNGEFSLEFSPAKRIEDNWK